jgi:hypothetical protein
MLLTKSAAVIIAALTLTACSSQYAALTNAAKPAAGYQEKLLSQQSPSTAQNQTYGKNQQDNAAAPNARYALIYHGTTSDSKARITEFWHNRAHKLCTHGYLVESHKQTIIRGTVRSPVNGIMVNLGTQQPIDKGIIECLE